MTNFSSVGTGAARLQNISPNPQKLTGMCAKLKCCLNYEVPVYEEASKQLPPRTLPLETKDGTYYLFATDPLKGEITYSTAPRVPANLQVITPERAKEIIAMNQRGEKPDSLGGKSTTAVDVQEVGYQNVVGQDDLTRFDKKRNNRPRNNDRNDRRNNNRNSNNTTRNNRNNGRNNDRKNSDNAAQ